MTTKLVTAVLMTADEMTPRLFDLDFQLLADAVLSIIAVFVLFLAMSYFLFNPAREFLKKRQDKIRNELEEARVSQEEAAALKKEYEDKLANINKEADEILSATRKKAMANETRIVGEARDEAARIVARAKIEADLEKKKVADEVKNEMVSLASVLAGKVIGNTIDAAAQDSLIDETLKEIGDSTWLS